MKQLSAPHDSDVIHPYGLTYLSNHSWQTLHKRSVYKDSRIGADTKDGYGQTPLSWAAENGHEVVVKLLEKMMGGRVIECG